MASNLLAMASNLMAMASKLVVSSFVSQWSSFANKNHQHRGPLDNTDSCTQHALLRPAVGFTTAGHVGQVLFHWDGALLGAAFDMASYSAVLG